MENPNQDSNAWFVYWLLIVMSFTNMAMNFSMIKNLDDVNTGSFKVVLDTIKAHCQ